MNCNSTDGIITFNDPPANGPLSQSAFWGSSPWYQVPSGWTGRQTDIGLRASPNATTSVAYEAKLNPDGSVVVQSMLLDRLLENY